MMMKRTLVVLVVLNAVLAARAQSDRKHHTAQKTLRGGGGESDYPTPSIGSFFDDDNDDAGSHSGNPAKAATLDDFFSDDVDEGVKHVDPEAPKTPRGGAKPPVPEAKVAGTPECSVSDLRTRGEFGKKFTCKSPEAFKAFFADGWEQRPIGIGSFWEDEPEDCKEEQFVHHHDMDFTKKLSCKTEDSFHIFFPWTEKTQKSKDVAPRQAGDTAMPALGIGAFFE